MTGLEALEKALYCWEDALTAFSSSFSIDALALPSKADAAFTQDVQELLDMGYQIQSQAELLFIDQVRFFSMSLLKFAESRPLTHLKSARSFIREDCPVRPLRTTTRSSNAIPFRCIHQLPFSVGYKKMRELIQFK